MLFIATSMISCCGLIKDNHLGQYKYTLKKSYTEKPIREIPIWIDRDFGNSDLIAIDDAINKWNYVLNGHIHLYIIDINFYTDPAKISEQQKLNGWIILKTNHNHNDVKKAIGFVDKINGNYIYLVRERLTNEDIFGVMLHEIAHLLGAKHNSQGLMYKEYNRTKYQCVDFDTMEEVADAQNLSIKDLNYCINF